MLEGRWRFAALITALVCAAATADASTVTGTIKKPDGTLVNGRIEFTLSQATTLPSPSTLFVAPPVYCLITLGAIQTSPACTVQDNASILPAGTTYLVRILDANNRVLMAAQRYTIPAGAVDFPSLPITAGLTLIPPTGSVTGNFSATGGGTFGGNLSVGGTLTIGGPSLIFTNQGSAPGTPASGKVEIYSKTDKLLYLKDDTGAEAPVGNTVGAMIETAPTDSVTYASQFGNSSNSGRSPGKAKPTVEEACYALFAGNAGTKTCGIGTVVAYDETNWSTQGATCGGLFMGPHDPNYASPPTCWMRLGGGLNIVGMGTQSFGPNTHIPQMRIHGGSTADRNHPGLWVSGNVQAFTIENVKVDDVGRPVVLGEDSNHNRTATNGSIAGVVLKNVGGSPDATAGHGPGLDLTNNSFWVWLKDTTFGGHADIDAATADNSAAMLIDGTGNPGQALIFIENCQLAKGGIKFIPGSGVNSMVVNGCTQEGDFTHAMPPAVWITTFAGSKSIRGRYSVTNTQTADSGSSTTSVLQVDGYDNPSAVVCGNLVGDGSRKAASGESACNGQAAGPADLGAGLSSGQIASMPVIAAQHSGAAWFGGPVAVKKTNYAVTNPASWNITSRCTSCTLHDGQTNPYGGTGGSGATGSGAAYVSTSGAGGRVVLSGGSTALNAILAVGGRVSCKLWTYSQTANNFSQSTNGGACYIGSSTFTETGTGEIDMAPVFTTNDGWTLLYASGHVATYTSSVTEIWGGPLDSTHAQGFYEPTMTYCAPSESDQECADYAMNGPTFPSTAAIGTLVPHTGMTYTGAVVGNASTASTVPQQMVYDNFNRANGGLGSNWSSQFGTLSVTSNAATGASGTNISYYTALSLQADQFVEMRVSTAPGSDNLGMCMRCSGTGASFQGYLVFVKNTEYDIYRVAGATPTFTAISGGNAGTFAAGDIIRGDVVGTSIRFYQNGTLLKTVSDSNYSSGQPGLYINNTVAIADDWNAGNIVAIPSANLENDWPGLQHFLGGFTSNSETGTGALVRQTSPSLITPSLGVAAFKRLASSQGTALVAGDFALSAGWGSGAAVSAVTGTDQGFDLTVTAGTSPTANPTITLTFKDGTWTNAPILLIQQRGGTGAQPTAINYTPSATAPVITWIGTPVNTNTYIISVIVMGR
jgi:hypothetical protein